MLYPTELLTHSASSVPKNNDFKPFGNCGRPTTPTRETVVGWPSGFASQPICITMGGDMGSLLGLIVVLLVIAVIIICVKHKPKSFREFLAILFEKESNQPPKKTDVPVELPYRSCKSLLTKGELAFYEVLREAIPEDFPISMKVRLADIITCLPGTWHKGHGARISQKHVDFVVLFPDTRICTVVELNDRTHQRASRKKRDKFLADALAVAKIELVTIQAASNYNVVEVRTAVFDNCVARRTV
ncbi:MAG: DUF2726 domain-containing protein [Planctomycetes bacterium]|nr:DUF2726 domain-containing protein [Planctomycetota bacterium]